MGTHQITIICGRTLDALAPLEISPLLVLLEIFFAFFISFYSRFGLEERLHVHSYMV